MKMGRINVKRKGDNFERKVADMLVSWWYPEVSSWKGKEKPFRRSPLSGGWSKRAGCDLIVPHDFPFLIEAKHRKSWKFDSVFDGGGELINWYFKGKQECQDYKCYGEAPFEARLVIRGLLLIFKGHYSRNIYVMFNIADLYEFGFDEQFWVSYASGLFITQAQSEFDKLCILKLEDFLKLDSTRFRMWGEI
jgi:hypothetical protein